ncbi:hypothetical protein IWQ62_000757 [Dispira parvispora]|uniref:alanine--glyoxylate transaminase n=1 Tax=Dispira parvispora TaxID=1520584 RepID=A0A9W8AWF0_9FUNG|nr:hypothetical protein IWQ62_000757 [Dispira parvispora]
MSPPAQHKLCMIPGPIECHEDVLTAMATPATSHIDPSFIQVFSETLKGLRQVVGTTSGQPFVVSGSGTLSWDLAVCNLVETGNRALVLSTGLFGDRMVDCLETYGAQVDVLRPADLGGVPDQAQVRAMLEKAGQSGTPYKLVTITHVDTSTGVLVDVQAVSKLVKEVSPTTLVLVDGVCSVAAEPLYMDDWKIDVVMTASQKALGCPPGLAIIVVSPTALNVWKTRKTKVASYYASWAKWFPVMQAYEACKPLYFATPAVQLVMALRVGVQQLLAKGMEHVYETHRTASDEFKKMLHDWGLRTLPTSSEVAAHSMTAVYYPPNVKATNLLSSLSHHGVLVAGGVHPSLAGSYFRVGHMGLSVLEPERGYLRKTETALQRALTESGYNTSA